MMRLRGLPQNWIVNSSSVIAANGSDAWTANWEAIMSASIAEHYGSSVAQCKAAEGLLFGRGYVSSAELSRHYRLLDGAIAADQIASGVAFPPSSFSLRVGVRAGNEHCRFYFKDGRPGWRTLWCLSFLIPVAL